MTTENEETADVGNPVERLVSLLDAVAKATAMQAVSVYMITVGAMMLCYTLYRIVTCH